VLFVKINSNSWYLHVIGKCEESNLILEPLMMKMNFYVHDVERAGNLKLLHKMYINVTCVLMFLVQVLSGKHYKNLNSNLKLRL